MSNNKAEYFLLCTSKLASWNKKRDELVLVVQFNNWFNYFC